MTQLEAAVLGLKAKEIFQTKAFTQSNYERGRTMIVKGGLWRLMCHSWHKLHFYKKSNIAKFDICIAENGTEPQ